jgi:hypothetical protein
VTGQFAKIASNPANTTIGNFDTHDAIRSFRLTS